MSLRIIGGEFRNRLLKSPKGEQTRPTLAVMRKAVFDILQTHIHQAHFLDLYAGSGAMGLESLSRGAAQATFVESDRFALRCIESNCKEFQVEKQTTILSYDCFLALKKLAKAGKTFDVVYADPPYAAGAKQHLLHELLALFDSSSLLNHGGILFLEEAVPPILKPEQLKLKRLHHIDTRTFSRSALHQFQMIQ